MILVHLEGPLDDLTLVFRDVLQVIPYSNLGDDGLVVEFLDVPFHIGIELT